MRIREIVSVIWCHFSFFTSTDFSLSPAFLTPFDVCLTFTPQKRPRSRTLPNRVSFLAGTLVIWKYEGQDSSRVSCHSPGFWVGGVGRAGRVSGGSSGSRLQTLRFFAHQQDQHPSLGRLSVNIKTWMPLILACFIFPKNPVFPLFSLYLL